MGHEKFTRVKKETPPAFIRVTTRVEEDGIMVYTDSNGVDLAWRLPRGGVVDLRHEPQFLSMSPCPYCGAIDDKGHNPLKHIHPYLGTKV